MPFYKLDEEYAEAVWCLDRYLLGGGGYLRFICWHCWWFHGMPPQRDRVERMLANLRETRLAPFLERAGLCGALSELPEEQFAERLLRLRYYLAEPDEPSEEVFRRLKLVIQLIQPLRDFLQGELDMLELKRALNPLRKLLAVTAPELHPLLYSIAEQLSLIGEQSPESKEQLAQELNQSCSEWLYRLHSYWHALLG